MSITAKLILAEAGRRLREAGFDDGLREARILLAEAMGVDRARLGMILDDKPSPAQAERFATMIAARLTHQPVAQIIGWREFWSRRFTVTPDVLDPRPDSETLIAAALEAPFQNVLELGVGSGALIITLLAERPSATGQGVDISPAALDVAQRNADAHGVAGRLNLQLSDWLADVRGRFDLIICNPPYIAEADWAALAPDVRLHEPKGALTPGADGLAAYRHLVEALPAFLAPGARVLFEIGFDQGADVRTLAQNAGWQDIRCIPDLNGHDRVVILQNPAN